MSEPLDSTVVPTSRVTASSTVPPPTSQATRWEHLAVRALAGLTIFSAVIGLTGWFCGRFDVNAIATIFVGPGLWMRSQIARGWMVFFLWLGVVGCFLNGVIVFALLLAGHPAVDRLSFTRSTVWFAEDIYLTPRSLTILFGAFLLALQYFNLRYLRLFRELRAKSYFGPADRTQRGWRWVIVAALLLQLGVFLALSRGSSAFSATLYSCTIVCVDDATGAPIPCTLTCVGGRLVRVTALRDAMKPIWAGCDWCTFSVGAANLGRGVVE